MKNLLHKAAQKWWYGSYSCSILLKPFSIIVQVATAIRRIILSKFVQQSISVPVIVVGNISVGGVGKTPLVIEIANKLGARGLKVGIVSRGYGAHSANFPLFVSSDASALVVGDEPLLIAQRTNCPVVIDPKRLRGARFLLEQKEVDVIVCDDGLQHYAMGRDIEIAVVDGDRGLGNGMFFPFGPLREGKNRLKQVDFVVVNGSNDIDGFPMNLVPGAIISLQSGRAVNKSELRLPVAAVAAIGNPQRFFNTLKAMGIEFVPYTFADHFQFSFSDLLFAESIVLMTEKDAVKCRDFATDAMYYLQVNAEIDNAFWQSLWLRLEEKLNYEATAV